MNGYQKQWLILKIKNKLQFFVCMCISNSSNVSIFRYKKKKLEKYFKKYCSSLNGNVHVLFVNLSFSLLYYCRVCGITNMPNINKIWCCRFLRTCICVFIRNAFYTRNIKIKNLAFLFIKEVNYLKRITMMDILVADRSIKVRQTYIQFSAGLTSER